MTDYLSLGKAAATYQKDPRKIEAALVENGKTPALTLNGVPYFLADDVSDANDLLNCRARQVKAKSAAGS